MLLKIKEPIRLALNVSSSFGLVCATREYDILLLTICTTAISAAKAVATTNIVARIICSFKQ